MGALCGLTGFVDPAEPDWSVSVQSVVRWSGTSKKVAREQSVSGHRMVRKGSGSGQLMVREQQAVRADLLLQGQTEVAKL